MKLSFAHTAPFVSRWRRLGLTDEDLQELERAIMERPDAGAVMRGTGGLRKMRFAPPSWRSGKSGATRVCYVVFVEADTCFLFQVFSKNEQPNLSDRDREELRKMIEEIRRSIARGRAR